VAQERSGKYPRCSQPLRSCDSFSGGQSRRADITWVWYPAGTPYGLPSVCGRSGLSAQPNLNRRHQARSRSFPSPASSTFFQRRFPSSLPTMSYNSSLAFHATAQPIGRRRPRQIRIRQEAPQPFGKSYFLPPNEESFSRIQGRTFHRRVGSIDVGVLSSLNWKSYPGNARKLGLTLRLSMFASVNRVISIAGRSPPA
jgi:hypothetical protein